MDRLSPLRQAALRRRLVPATLKYAVRSIPYYRDLFGGRSAELQLADFPIIDKEFKDENTHRLLNLEYLPEITLTTGGSTRFPSATFQTRAELDRMISYGYDLRPGDNYPDTFRRFTLHVGIVGPTAVGPRGRPLLSVPLTKPGQFPIVQEVLAKGMPVRGRIRRVGTLLCPARELKLLTLLLEKAGFDPRPLGLESVLAYSDHLTASWRDRLETYWGSPVRPVYGLSEFSYAATIPCADCAHHHLPSFVHPEVVHPARRQSIGDDGLDGVLVLTSLYPFVRAHPHIRYWTGDVVRLGPVCGAFHERGFRFLGRQQHTAMIDEAGRARCVLSPIDILEAADHVPGVAYENPYPELGARPAIGSPMAHIELVGRAMGPQTVVLTVAIDGPEPADFAQAWEGALCRVNSGLGADLRHGRVTLKVRTASRDEVRRRPGYVPLA